MSSSENRQYSDEELGLIVQRASELQDQASETGAEALPSPTVPPSLPTGVTLQAVREIADAILASKVGLRQACAKLLGDDQ